MTPQSDPGRPLPGPGTQVPAGPPAPPPPHPMPGGVGTIAPPNADDDAMPMPSGRGPASTKIMLVMVLVAVAFMGGVMAQKKNDEGMIRPAKGPMAAFSGAIGPGAGGAPGGAPGGMPGASPTDMLAAAANLKGEVVSVNGTEVVVRDQNGVERKATLAPGALVLKSGSLESLQPGSRVLVAGKDNPDGSATAVLVVAP